MEHEIPVTSPTGGTKNQKLARFDLIPPLPLRKLAEQYGRGAAKYGEHNWRKGYPWSLSYAAAIRHLNAFWGGEDWDQEFPDAHHLDAAMFHLMSLRDFVENQKVYDDRPTRSETERLERESGVAQTSPHAGAGGWRNLTETKQFSAERLHGPVQTSRREIP